MDKSEYITSLVELGVPLEEDIKAANTPTHEEWAKLIAAEGPSEDLLHLIDNYTNPPYPTFLTELRVLGFGKLHNLYHGIQFDVILEQQLVDIAGRQFRVESSNSAGITIIIDREQFERLGRIAMTANPYSRAGQFRVTYDEAAQINSSHMERFRGRQIVDLTCFSYMSEPLQRLSLHDIAERDSTSKAAFDATLQETLTIALPIYKSLVFQQGIRDVGEIPAFIEACKTGKLWRRSDPYPYFIAYNH